MRNHFTVKITFRKILAIFRPMCIGFHAEVVLGLSKDFLCEGILGQCTVPWNSSRTNAVVHVSRVLNVDM